LEEFDMDYEDLCEDLGINPEDNPDLCEELAHLLGEEA
jgi:hypothetical protein